MTGTPSMATLTPAVCTVGSGQVSFVGTGTWTLVASVAAGDNYLAATGVEQSFLVGFAEPFASTCTYTINPKNGSCRVTVSWANAVPA